MFKIGPTDPLPTCATAFRRLFKFAHTQVAGASGKANHVGEDESSRLLAVEEREVKRQKLVANLGGLVILGGHTEPAWDTVDRIRSFMRIGEVEWIPWDECPSRDSEKAAKEGKTKWIAHPASGTVK